MGERLLAALRRQTARGGERGAGWGVDLAGVIAEEIQLHQVFAAAVVAGSKEVDAAKRLIAFLASERAAATIRSSGMEPPGKRH